MGKKEIIIGLVAPMGCGKDLFFSAITSNFKKQGFEVVPIKVTDLLYQQANNYPHSLDVFCKMQICSELRLNYRGFIAALIVENIKNKREGLNDQDKIVYIIDQLKNEAECEILSHVYGVNYLQVSLFSNYYERDKNLKKKFSGDMLNEIDFKTENSKLFDSLLLDNICNNKATKDQIKSKLANLNDKKLIETFRDQVLNDTTHMLIEKDNKEIDSKHKDSGQQIANLFHKSHYFINLDSPNSQLLSEVQKFTDQLFGEHKEYPTQDEFGMTLAYHASFRSNFPGDRHIGASIIAENGEVVSLGSIRAPSSSSNPALAHQDSITDGYQYYYKKIGDWKKELDSNECNIKSKEDIRSFLSDSIDFHPCTHAEIAAIIDAAKLGVSVRNATLYTTTFPCHLCAKDIVTAGIKKVIFLEAYPKSKSKELYPSIIDLNAQQRKDIIPFENYMGVAPNRYHYVYALKNKPPFSPAADKDKNPIGSNKVSPYLMFIRASFYEKQESDVINHFVTYLNNGNQEELSYLTPLVQNPNQE
jgi:deoxycytidylate deaminase